MPPPYKEKFGEEKPISIWLNFLKIIDTKNIGDYVYRKELVKKKYSHKIHTVDTYRSMLNKVGILETIKPGVYIKRKNIKKDFPLSLLREIAYDNTWKSWFYKFD